MRNQIARTTLVLLVAATALLGADLESAEKLYLSGDHDGARQQLEELLADEPDDATRARALEMLGRVAIDEKDWQAALAAWGELSDDLALSPEAAAVSAAIRPLQALAECGCGTTVSPELVAATEVSTAAPAQISPPTPASPPAPVPAYDGFLVGSWGFEYEASEQVAARLIDFLDANGVAVRTASTEIPAIRGEEVVLSYLIEEARSAGAAGILFVTTRFGYREFVEVRAYDVNGVQLWRDRQVGGTALKEKQERGRVSWGLVDRITKKLSKRLGSPDLPTG